MGPYKFLLDRQKSIPDTVLASVSAFFRIY
uniref:Uncharacterized protein n=1 Tax=Rhizophora mucronata TaxID=61149 RepID=A0A2P2PDV6_RHIMU